MVFGLESRKSSCGKSLAFGTTFLAMHDSDSCFLNSLEFGRTRWFNILPDYRAIGQVGLR